MPTKRIKQQDGVSNTLQFDSASTNITNINENFVKYRQRILSQFVSETTNSNDTLEWNSIEFPGHCCNLSMSPNEKFLVVQYHGASSQSMFAKFEKKNDLAFYNLRNYKIEFKLLFSDMNWKLSNLRPFSSFYWLNDNYLCIFYNHSYSTYSSQICLVNVMERKCYLLDKKNGDGQLFAVNNKQFVLITSKEIECFNISLQAELVRLQASNTKIISLKPYSIIPFSFNNSDLICGFKECEKLQLISEDRAVIIMPVIPGKKAIWDAYVKVYLFDLCTFKLIDTKCVFKHSYFDGNTVNSPSFCFNKINTSWNWVNSDHFFVIDDTESTKTCTIYKCNIDYVDNKYSMQCIKFPEISKKDDGEKPERSECDLLIHPLSNENVIIQKYSKYCFIERGIKRWHQYTQICDANVSSVQHLKRYKYFTYKAMTVDQLSGLVLVESKFVHESKSACFNGRDVEKPCTYGIDVVNALNGNKVGFIAIPQFEMEHLDRPAWKFSGFDNLSVGIGINCMILHVDGSKYAHLLMNMRSCEYWSDLLYSTSWCNKDRTIANVVASFLCY